MRFYDSVKSNSHLKKKKSIKGYRQDEVKTIFSHFSISRYRLIYLDASTEMLKLFGFPFLVLHHLKDLSNNLLLVFLRTSF